MVVLAGTKRIEGSIDECPVYLVLNLITFDMFGAGLLQQDEVVALPAK